MTVSDRARETNIAFDCLAAALEHYCHQFQYTRRGLRAENQWTYENDFLRLTRAICEERLKFAWHLWKLGSRLGENGQTFRRLSSTRVGILLKDIKYLLKLMRLPNDEPSMTKRNFLHQLDWASDYERIASDLPHNDIEKWIENIATDNERARGVISEDGRDRPVQMLQEDRGSTTMIEPERTENDDLRERFQPPREIVRDFLPGNSNSLPRHFIPNIRALSYPPRDRIDHSSNGLQTTNNEQATSTSNLEAREHESEAIVHTQVQSPPTVAELCDWYLRSGLGVFTFFASLTTALTLTTVAKKDANTAFTVASWVLGSGTILSLTIKTCLGKKPGGASRMLMNP